MRDQLQRRRHWKRWFHAGLATLVLGSGLSLGPVGKASAGAATAVADPSKVYVSLKNADFGASNPLVGTPQPAVVDNSPGNGLSQLGGITAGGLQYNFGRANNTFYSNPEISGIGFQNDRVRLATTIGNAFGSVFNRERVTLADNRSFSTYFSFKMDSGSQADGIVFVVQTASNQAGAVGGGLGYAGVAKSIGVEYDTYYNVGTDNGTPRNDPAPVEGVTINRASHVALVRNGDVDHNSTTNGGKRPGKNIAALDLKKFSLAQTSSEASADPYSKFHSWIDYNGLTNKFEVYLIRENNDGSFWAPIVKADGTLQVSGSGASAQIDAVKLTSFPHLESGKLFATQSGGGNYEIKPIISDTTDLASLLLSDDAYIGFTAATGGAHQHHDIFSWYFNNHSGLIAPGSTGPTTVEAAVEQTPNQIQILNQTALTSEGINYDFKKDAAHDNLPYGNKPVTGTAGTGIVATGASAPVQAQVRTVDGELIAGYPVTFSLYYVESYSNENIGSGRTAIAAKQKDDEDTYLTAEGYAVKTAQYQRSDGTTITVRGITVPTDANGVATVDVWNLGDYPHLTNVRARIGGELGGHDYGGGNSASAPVLFAKATPPVVKGAEVGPDRHTIIIESDSPVESDPDKPEGFKITVDDPTNPSGPDIDVPLKVVGYGKDVYGKDDPFKLVLEIDPSNPGYPPQLPTDYVIPPNTNPPLSYDQSKGSVSSTGGGEPLKSFPGESGSPIPVSNRFAAEGMSVVNDVYRNKIEISFPNAIDLPGDVRAAFTASVDGGAPIPPTGMIYDPTNPDKLKFLFANGALPLDAKISLTYEPSLLPEGYEITSGGSPLDRFVNDPVANQMKPSQAVVINDVTRDKVRVVFSKPLDPVSVTSAVYAAFAFNIAGVDDPVPATNAQLSADGKTLIFTLGEGLPVGGIPTLANESDPTNITLNYAAAMADDIRETGRDARSLGWLTTFPVVNQLTFDPVQVSVDPENRNEVNVKFPSDVNVDGTPEFTIVINGTPYPGTILGRDDDDDMSMLTLKLPGDVTIQPGDSVTLNYSPNGGNVIDKDDPQRVLKPQTGTSAENVYVAIATPVDGDLGYRPVSVVTGTSAPGSTVTVVVRNSGGASIDGVIDTQGNGNWTWTPGTAEVPAPISASETYSITATAKGAAPLYATATATSGFKIDHTLPHGGTITLVANPLRNVGDGSTTTTLTATVIGGDGDPVSGVAVQFAEAVAGGGSFIDSHGATVTEADTDDDGKAVIYYKSPDLAGITEPKEIVIDAKVVDIEEGISAYQSFTIYFEPPTLRGKITETDGTGTQHPVAGKTITIRNANGDIVGTTVTDEFGNYEFRIPSSGTTYTIEYTKDIGNGHSITYKQNASVDIPLKGDGTDAATSNKAVAGVLGSKSEDGSMQVIDMATFKANNVALNPSFVVFLKQNGKYVDQAHRTDGATLTTATEADGFPIGNDGLFVADGLPQGATLADNTYDLEIRYYYEELDASGTPTGTRNYIVVNVKRGGELPSVVVNDVGELNISEELIDPYGDIRDAGTGALIDDRQVTVKLWYADTARNRAKGVSGPVSLPALPGFPPADNASPVQNVTGGSYAWLVYADTDYYITATANGYNTYDSRYDRTVRPDVFVENDLRYIKVDSTIVRFDISMAKNSPVILPTDPKPTTEPKVVVNVQTDRTIAPESGQGGFEVTYKNLSDTKLDKGQIRVVLPEGAEVIDAAGGTVLAGMIVWDLKDLAGGASGSLSIKIKWPQLKDGEQERVLTVKGEFAKDGDDASALSSSASSAKLLVYSGRAGNLKHERYVLGYPDGTFKADRSLTRAELAAIIARLIGEYGTTAKAYLDVPKDHWAYDYINTVTKHGIFEGDESGKFRPNDPVSRGELAAVMTRYLQLETGTPIQLHYADVTDGFWATAAIESLYRNGMIQGYPDGTFKPQNGIVRSEAVTLINRMLYRGPLTDIEQSWPDIVPSFWAFGNIEEASVSHESVRTEVGGKTVETFVRKLEDDVQ